MLRAVSGEDAVAGGEGPGWVVFIGAEFFARENIGVAKRGRGVLQLHASRGKAR